MRYVKIIYNSFLWAMIIALTCFKSEWIQMRVNTGYICFGSFIVLSLLIGFILHKKKTVIPTLFTIGNLIVCTVYGIILYGFERLKIVPAALIREGIHQTSIPFATMNMLLLVAVVVPVLVIVITDVVKKE